MKPPAFEYAAPTSIDEALELMNEHGWDAKVLAGGQSLIPMMNFRLAAPAVLVDLNSVDELTYIREDNGGLSIGAMTRQRTVERSTLVAERAPLIADAMPYVAHPQIRNRGTFGGSIAHADPASEVPALAVALNARLKVQSVDGERWIDADDFFQGLFTVDLAPEEVLTEVVIPEMPARTGWAFEEVARRHGDYALVGLGATVTLDDAGICTDARLVYLGVGETPVDTREAAGVLVGETPSEDAIRAVSEAVDAEIDPTKDIHASAKYRRHLAKTLAKRALSAAIERAQSE